MARADSTIRVNVIGDSRGLSKELRTADTGVKNLGVSMRALAGGLVFGAVTAGVVEFGSAAVQEADRLGDATTRLEQQLGDSAKALIDTADDFTHLGQSTQDILELEAAFADIATSLGISEPDIAAFADDVAATAAAVSLLTGEDPATVVANIGKAAGGAEKPLKTLGVHLDEDAVAAQALADTGKKSAEELTENELASARLKIILEQLKPKLDDANQGLGDTEQKAGELGAKIETLQGQFGTLIDPYITGLIDGLLEGSDAWARMFDEMGKGDWSITQEEIGETFGLLGDLMDIINDVIGGLQDIAGTRIPTQQWPGGGGGGGGSGQGAGGGGHHAQGGSPNVNQSTGFVTNAAAFMSHAQVEQTVIAAVRGHAARNGVEIDL